MLSNSNPYVYYLSFLGPSSLILLLNLSLFILVARVLFLPRNATVTVTTVRKNSVTGHSSSGQQVVTLAQVRVAFTVMVLLSVSWVFGDLTVGELNLFFEYVFGICNFLQGFFIFVARCICVADARVAWIQLIRTGTLKKYRGVVPPGTTSFYANSGSNHNEQSTIPKSTSQHSNSRLPNTNTRHLNSNFWTSNSRLSQAMRNSFAEADIGWNRSCLTFAPLGSSVQSIVSESKVSNLDSMSAMNCMEDDDQSEFERYSRPLTLQLQQEHDTSSQSSGCTRSSNLSEESPNCSFCGRQGCNALDDSQCFITELSYITV